MKTLKFIFFPCVIMVLLFGVICYSKHDADAASSDFEIKDGVLVSYKGKNKGLSTNIIIPDSVTAIGKYSFFAMRMKSVKIPNSVRSIGSAAFGNCDNLERVTMTNSVKSMGSDAFGDCNNLKSITLSSSLKNIKTCTFSDCKQLRSITIPSSVNSINEGALQCCRKLRYVTVSDTLKEIHWTAFSGSNKNLTFYAASNSFVASFASREKFHYKTLALNKTRAIVSAGKTLKLRMNSFADCTWRSGNKKIATVSSTGKVTARRKGRVIITARLYGKKYQCIMTVK